MNSPHFHYDNHLGYSDIKEARLLLTDACTYSCSWCAVHQYKKGESINGTGYNEGALVQDIKFVRGKQLSYLDYYTLTHVLSEHFGTQDFTLTGGEAFLRKEYKSISESIKSTGARVTALTKGEPLYRILQKNKTILEFTDRIVFSIDTLDNIEHAKLNLPLMRQNKAEGYLNKTFQAVSSTLEQGKEVSINTVVPPNYIIAKNIIFGMIHYALENDITDLKLMELDTNTITVPYIESFMRALLTERESY